mgnify:CR=1 FL=1
MDKITTVINEKAVKEYLSPLVKFIIFCFVGFIIFIALYFIFAIISNNWLDPLHYVFIAVALICLVGAFIFLFKYLKSINLVKKHQTTLNYEFFDDYFIFISSNENRKVDERKIFYSDLVSYRESKNYYFLMLNDNNAFIINKNEEVIKLIKEKGISKTRNIIVRR